MEEKKGQNQNSKSLKTKKCNYIWSINYYNTSDVGYPDEEYYTQVEKED